MKMPLPQNLDEAKRGYSRFESEVLSYLRNLASKFHYLADKVRLIQKGQECLQSSVMKLGQANSEAYKRVKLVVNDLASKTSTVVSDLSYAMGTVRCCDFDPDSPFEDNEELIIRTV